MAKQSRRHSRSADSVSVLIEKLIPDSILMSDDVVDYSHLAEKLFNRCQWCPICRAALLGTSNGKKCPKDHGKYWVSSKDGLPILEFVPSPSYIKELNR